MADKLIVGCGYLGRRIAELWRAQGHRVQATIRRPERAAELATEGLHPIVADVLDPTTLRTLPAVDTVVYCVGFDRSLGVAMRAVYVDGLANVLNALPHSGRFVYVSSTGVYGQDQGEEVDETAPTEPGDESGRVVLAAERLLRDRLPGAIVLRFAGIYGPGRLIRARGFREGEPLTGDPNRWLNLIQVEDGATAVDAATQHGRPGEVYNVCDDRPVRRREYYQRLADLLGAPPPRFVAAEPGTLAARHERAHRRILNRRLRQELAVSLRYPSCAEGLPASVEATPGVQG